MAFEKGFQEVYAEEPIVLAAEHKQAMVEKTREYERRLADQIAAKVDALDILDTRCKLLAGKMALEYELGAPVPFVDYKARLSETLSPTDKVLVDSRYKPNHERVDDDAFKVVRDYASRGGAGVLHGTGFGPGKHG